MKGPTLSASRVTTFEGEAGCERKYALSRIADIKTPETESQALGKDVDDNYLQPYLRDGKPISTDTLAGKIASSGLKFLPPPKHPGLEVQKHFLMPSPSGRFWWQGYLDLWLPGRGLPDFDSRFKYTSLGQGLVPIVGDFKTTKSKRYAKTPEQLSEDPQAQLYATWAMRQTGSREVDLAWLYMQTKPDERWADIRFLRVDGDHVAKQYMKLDEVGHRIADLHAKAPAKMTPEEAQVWALEQKPNRGACGAFGGCQYKHLCFTREDYINDFLGEGDDSALKRHLPIVGNMGDTLDLFAELGTKRNEVLGINPPQKVLPPASPVGEVVIPDAKPAPAEDEEKPKRKRRTKAEIEAARAGVTEADKAQIAEDLAEIRQGAAAPTVDVDVVPAGVDFDIAWAELGSAIKRFFMNVGRK